MAGQYRRVFQGFPGHRVMGKRPVGAEKGDLRSGPNGFEKMFGGKGNTMGLNGESDENQVKRVQRPGLVDRRQGPIASESLMDRFGDHLGVAGPAVIRDQGLSHEDYSSTDARKYPERIGPWSRRTG